MSLACSDSTTRELSGTQAGPAHTFEQAAVQLDLTATDTFANGIHSYTATLPPAQVVGSITQRLEGSWDPNLQSLREPPIYPQYWSIDYYAGSTKLPKVPATASEWAQVSRVVATGNVQVEALDGERQALVSTLPAPPPKVAPSFSGGSTGDGWDLFFDPAFTRVFNIHHHGSPATTQFPPTLMCRNLEDSTTCPGFPITLTQTSHRSTGRIDLGTNKLWHPTVTTSDDQGNPNKLAWDCVDLTTATRCATPRVVSNYVGRPNSTGLFNDHIDPVVIGRKMYALGFVTGDVTRITCLDMATGTECPGMALPQNGSFFHSGLEAVGTRLYVLPGANLNLDCYDSTTWTRCAGSWPQPVAAGGPVWGVRGADSVVRNICANNKCFGLDGSAHTLPPNFAARLAANPVVGRSYTYIQVGMASSVGTKAAWPINGDRTDCWDMATDAACAPAFPIAVRQIYASVLDPQDPDCLWTNGDDGIIRNWKTSTATQGCGGGPLRISFRALVSIPRLGCDPESRVYQYKSFKLVEPSPEKYTSARLTVKNSEGVPISGWSNVPIPPDAIVDLSGLSQAVAGNTPTFDVATTDLTDNNVVPVAEFRVTTGASPQLCWALSTSTSAVCPSTPGVAGSSASVPRSTDVTAKGSLTVNANTTAYTDQVMTTTVNPNPPTAENCGTRLRATVTSLADGSPVSGARVFLLDGAGNSILDANGQPVSEVSAADGTLEFSVWAASYTLKMSGTSNYTPVFTTVTAGGSGTTFVSGGTVVSNTVTTTRGQTSHVALTVHVNGHTGLCAPVVTSPPGGTVVYTRETPLKGTAEAGSTVIVRANNQLVCTVVATPEGTWSCTAELPVGTSTVTAISRDSAGNTSDTSSGVLITRRDQVDPPVITGPGANVQGPGVTVTGTGQPGSDITVKDGHGKTVCTAKVDDTGAWQCEGNLAPGQHQLTASADWEGLQGTSSPHDVMVQTEAWFQGGSCAATGGVQPALMVVVALGGLVVRRRRRA